jgi:hypothetical protein
MAMLASSFFSKLTRGGFVRPVVAVAVLLLLAVSVSVAGAARSGDFRDEFTSFEVRRWVKIGRPFGHGTLDPANVTVADGLLGISSRRARSTVGRCGPRACIGTARTAPG